MKPDRNDLLHIESSALIVIVLLLFLPWWCACPLALAVGAGKELWDKGHGGIASWGDIIHDIVGIILGIGIYLI